MDACWALTGPRLFLDLTADRGWQPDQYEDWLVRMLTANLLAPVDQAPAPGPGSSAAAGSVQPLG